MIKKHKTQTLDWYIKWLASCILIIGMMVSSWILLQMYMKCWFQDLFYLKWLEMIVSSGILPGMTWNVLESFENDLQWLGIAENDLEMILNDLKWL